MPFAAKYILIKVKKLILFEEVRKKNIYIYSSGITVEEKEKFRQTARARSIQREKNVVKRLLVKDYVQMSLQLSII